MSASTTETMFGDVIKLLHGDRPAHSDRLLYDAAIAIRDAMPDLNPRQGMEVETLLAHAVHYAHNLPAIEAHAWARMQSPYALRRNPANGIEPTPAAVCKAITERLAGFRRETEANEDTNEAHRKLTEQVNELKTRFPNLNLSFGYIGNCDLAGGRYDDRAWMIFTTLATPTCSGGCDVSFGSHHTSQLGSLMLLAERGLEEWCVKQQQRLDAGEIRQVKRG